MGAAAGTLRWMHTDVNGPIGVFDSGVGGLTVLKALEAVLPGENFIYFGDTARLPYGNKSDVTVLRYAFENALFLLRRGAKALVVACNTASAVASRELRRYFRIPVVAVVELKRYEVANLVTSLRGLSLGLVGKELEGLVIR